VAVEAKVSPKQMSYGQFSREVGGPLADCFDGPPVATVDENPARQQHALETLTALKEEFLGGVEIAPEHPASGLRGRLEALQKLLR
jgi:hypothetical protein